MISLLTQFSLNGVCYPLAIRYIKELGSNISCYLQELLDIRQRQRTGTQLVQEIRKQADDVLHFPLVHLVAIR